MKMQRIDITHEFNKPVADVFAALSDHEKLTAIFPAKIKRVKDGKDSVNGQGSVRQLKPFVLPSFDETVIAFEPNRRIEYTITRGSPLNDHRGVMEFEANGSGTRLHYTITFRGKVPLVGPLVKLGLERLIRHGLKSLA